MPTSQTEEIKSRIDIVELIRQYVRIEKAGINFRGLCPFHKEKSPSFFISPSRQIWRCFGCGVGGDAFSFVQQIEGVDFPDALRSLAQRAGVELHYENVQERSERSRMFELLEAATAFFQESLRDVRAENILQYLHDRGLNEESINAFRLGYAPRDSERLIAFLRAKKFSENEMVRAGLIISGGGQPPRAGTVPPLRNRFAGRIMFPISDIQGRPIAFGGRVTEEEKKAMEARDMHVAKYINSPQTLLYEKSSILYGVDKARLAVRQKDFCIVVEGYTDVIMAHQTGWQNVVASSGTAFTERQLDLVKRYTQNLYTAFDMDVAGDTATKRGIDLAQQKGFNIRVITFEGGKDPADIVKDHPDVWEKSIEQAQPILDFYFANTLSRFNAAIPEQKAAIGNVLLPIIARIANHIEQAHWVQKLAETLRVGEQSVWEELKAVPAQKTAQPERGSTPLAGSNPALPAIHFAEQKNRSGFVKDRLLALLVQHPELHSSFAKDVSASSERAPHAPSLPESISDLFLERIAKSPAPLDASVLQAECSAEQSGFLQHLLFQHEVLAQEAMPHEQEYAVLMKELWSEQTHSRLQDLHDRIRACQEKGEDTSALMEEVRKIAADLGQSA